jgi:superoxide dismutase, Fe-Mn family
MTSHLTLQTSRRRFLSGLGVAGLSLALPSRAIADELKALPAKPPTKPIFDPKAPYATLPPLTYAYDALAPFIDEKTMTIHHDLHHGAYVKNLNAALEKHPKYKETPIEDLFRILNKLPEDIRSTVRNNGGGHYNHSLFWESMAPNAGGEPTGKLAKAIVKTFGSFAEFKTQFQDAGMKRFGSGWVWLAITRRGDLAITSTPNQDNPCMVSDKPILGNDLWEHAYYLTYQNRRAEYLTQWWNVVNWTVVNDRYEKAIG